MTIEPAALRKGELRRWLRLTRRPSLCCGCLCLSPAEAHRARRVFKIVRQWKRRQM